VALVTTNNSRFLYLAKQPVQRTGRGVVVLVVGKHERVMYVRCDVTNCEAAGKYVYVNVIIVLYILPRR